MLSIDPAPAAPRRHRARAVALLALCACSAAAQALTADRYELALTPDFDARMLNGQARLHLKADGDAATALELAAPNLAIRRVQTQGRDVPFEKTGNGWRIALSDAQAGAAELWLDIDYRAPPAEGLVFGEQHVYTAFHTCHWMPCASPELGRVAITIALTLPPGYRSVASDAARPYPLYTLGFAAGRFAEAVDAGAPRLRALGATDDAPALRMKFKDSARVLAFFEDKAGVPLPPTVYTQVLVPGGVAQEMSTFSVIGKRALDPIVDDPEEDWVIAHEMAHQWWGNLITCASWNEFWLNEGITVFMTAAWKQQRWGDAAYERELALARQRWQRAKDAGFDRPLSWPGEYPSLALRRAVQYSKGALFMDALRGELGEEAFWDGLRRYTRDNAGRGVRSRDLQAAMESSAGRSLQPLFARWVY